MRRNLKGVHVVETRVRLEPGEFLDEQAGNIAHKMMVLGPFRADAQVDHFFKHDGWSLSNININLEYVIPATDAINVYPLAGLALVGFSENNFGFMSHAKAGFNIGAGAELPVNDKWKVFLDAKYQIVSDAGRLIPTLGILVKL